MKNITVIKKDKLLTSKWSGGNTTQLYIYPEDETYEDRNFKFRISSAVVDVEESEFTKLPNFKRKIMILEGKIKLVHENHHSVNLEKYQQHTFYGHWMTKSYGKVKDFNLMLSDGVDGIIEYINLKNQKGITYDDNEKYENLKEFFCVIKGRVNISMGNENELIEAGDLAIIRNRGKVNISVENKAQSNSELIKTKVYY